MQFRRWVLAPVVGVLLGTAAVSYSPVLAQQKKDQKLDKAQQQEVQAAYKIADAVEAGQAAPAEVALSLHTDFLKAHNNLTFVPFILSFDPAQLPSRAVTLYLRVVAKAPPVPAADAKKAATPKTKDGAAKAPEFAFQDVHFIDLKAGAPGEPVRITRAFSVAAGEYDVYVVLKDRTPANPKDKAAGPKVGYLKQAVTVPDFWTSELTTSSLILVEDVKPADKAGSAGQSIEQPYTLGGSVFTPVSTTRLSKKTDVFPVFFIYNTAQDAGRKPDIAVEYNFYQRFADKTEKFFNKTNPQAFNATTLPAQFDAAVHSLIAGQAVPLEKFPEGEYRLEIKITDKLSGKVLTRNVTFFVTA